MNRIMQTLIAFDQLLNAALCDGCADETMSSNSFRMERDGKPWGFMRRVIDWLALPWQANHCHQAYLNGLLRQKSQPEDRING